MATTPPPLTPFNFSPGTLNPPLDPQIEHLLRSLCRSVLGQLEPGDHDVLIVFLDQTAPTPLVVSAPQMAEAELTEEE